MIVVKQLKEAKAFFLRHNGIGLLLIMSIVFASMVTNMEMTARRKQNDQTKVHAAAALSIAKKNTGDIEALKKEVSVQASKPPVIIVKETKVHEKPFADPSLLHAARKLRDDQKLSDATRTDAKHGAIRH